MKPLTSISSPAADGAIVAATAVAVCASLWAVFAHAPIEAQMGIVQKIFYWHVPAAIVAYLGFTASCVASIGYILRRDPRWDVHARAGAEVGVLFCMAVLITGPLWARKAWGAFWTGEPRLMLTLVLFLVFVAYLLVRSFGGRGELTRKIGAVLAILGFADIPLVRYSVMRWGGNHPQVVTGEGGGIAPDMQVALAASFVAIALVATVLYVWRVRVGLIEEDVERFHRAVAARAHRVDDLAIAHAEG